MAVRIRFARFGRKHHPVYRIVVMDSRSPREGKYIDILGTFDPKNRKLIEVKKEKIKDWLYKGVQIGSRIKALLESEGILGDLIEEGWELKRSGDYWVVKKKRQKATKEV
jgi:small subunit ribosomal protein S16